MTYFEEKQHFSRWWVLLMLPAPIIATTLQFIPSTREEDAALALVIVWCLCGGIALMFMCSYLDTKITSDEIQIRFPPFINKPKVISISEIKTMEVRKYDPLGEYGGWGIRYGWTNSKRNRAYNIKGSDGLQLVLHDGMRILIGTQKPDEIRKFILTQYADRVV